RPPRDPFSLRDLVELLPVAVLQRVPGLAAALAATPGLLLEASPSALRKRSDRSLLRRCLLRLLDVLAGGAYLLCGRHPDPPFCSSPALAGPAPVAAEANDAGDHVRLNVLLSGFGGRQTAPASPNRSPFVRLTASARR